jgi:hypothetical protein
VEQPGDEFRLRSNVVAANIPKLPFPDHRHRFVACQRPSSCPEAAKPMSRTGQSFHLSVVLLDDIISVFYLSQP